MAELGTPGHVHHLEDGSGRSILLNVRTGQWFLLNRTAAHFWRVLSSGQDIQSAMTAIVNAYPNVPESQIRRDIEQFTVALTKADLITLDITVTDTTGQVQMAFPRRSAIVPNRADVVVAVFALPAALALLRMRFGRCVSITTEVIRRTRREASFEEAQRLVAASYDAARWYPGRAACLEISLTAVIAAALRGCRLRWCLGTADDPRRFHAWVEVDGRVVPDPVNRYSESTYQRVFSI
jgi:Transglutaminase-like superfamily/Coenzyme PQQ synthesis protein D (PqqD)